MIAEHVARAKNLTILCCHGVHRSLDFREPFADASWVLLPYQKGDPRWYWVHMRQALRLVADDERALLVISGGQTRAEAGQISEAGSYWRLFEHLQWDGNPGVRQRSTTEEFAGDSLQNVLFSICRFREVVGRYPELVRVVSWMFKASRFELHRQALRWPRPRFRFEGLGAPDTLRAAEEGERRVLDAFVADPYGAGPDLVAKRQERNPFRRQHGYADSCPEVTELLAYKGPEPFPGILPWLE